MLSLEKIEQTIEMSNELKEVTIDSMGGETCYIKKFTRRDTKEFSKSSDFLAAMIYVGVVDDNGVRIFKDAEQVQDLSDKVVGDLFTLVSEYNAESAEHQAKKS